ncbi:MAG: amino acid permease [Berryella intestinalis]|uniref:amino acid permease n=1 Tax=Berryella intestinalis TaxID=1531429 RepID=UPI002A55A8E1|nr:amino acid permease [Berryella intestinalis]MDD7369324.1 amino acid permease [Berryella intestinalis]MDY3128702.1 amino acid permease [Berryella intestinalis]
MGEKIKGVGFFGLVGMVVSSCIGSGVFAISGQIGQVASPGAALIAWLVCGLGFLCLALSLANLGAKCPDSDGAIAYAEDGFGKFAGFISGWGYWLSAWLGNVAFATMIANTLGTNECLGTLLPGVFSADGNPAVGGVIVISVLLWLITFLVINGVESAAGLNAVVMVVKVVSIAALIMFCVIAFQAATFTDDFWGNATRNMAVMAEGISEEGLGSIGNQITNCILIMMWVFIGIEGASVMSKRAAKKSEVGSATVLGLIVLLVLYIGASILPYGAVPYEALITADNPATVTIFETIAPGWGGAFISWAIIISVVGSWLSFTMLPAETTSMMADHGILPKVWDKRNEKNAPKVSLLIVGACTEVFIIVATFSSSAYDFAFSMCTVAIVITWSLAAAYQVKYSAQHKEMGQLLLGVIALTFQIVGVLFNGYGFLLLTCLGYVPGFFFYKKAREENGATVTKNEYVFALIIGCLGVLGVVLNLMGVISVF